MKNLLNTCTFVGNMAGEINNYEVNRLHYRKAIASYVRALIEQRGVKHFILGLSRGFEQDMFAMLQAIKTKYTDITIEVVVPFKAQPATWTIQEKTKYFEMLKVADKVVYLDSMIEKGKRISYARRFDDQRNYMINNADYVISLFNGNNNSLCAHILRNISQRKHIKGIYVLRSDNAKLLADWRNYINGIVSKVAMTTEEDEVEEVTTDNTVADNNTKHIRRKGTNVIEVLNKFDYVKHQPRCTREQILFYEQYATVIKDINCRIKMDEIKKKNTEEELSNQLFIIKYYNTLSTSDQWYVNYIFKSEYEQYQLSKKLGA